MVRRISWQKWHWGCDLKDANKSGTFELEDIVNGGNERRPFCAGLELGVVIVEQLERGGEHHEFHVSRVFKGGGEMVE